MIDKNAKNNKDDKKEIYQELYSPDNMDFFRNRDNIPYYIVIGMRGESFDDDLAIPIERNYLQNTLRQFIEEYILNKDESSFLESLKLGNIVEIDINLKQKLRRIFNELKGLLTNKKIDIYLEPLDLGPEWQRKGQLINEKKIDLDSPILENLIYIDINSPEDSYIDVKQYMARFKIELKEKIEDRVILSEKRITQREEKTKRERFSPVLSVFDYTPNKEEIMKIDAVKNRIEERKKWLPYKEDDLFYLIFSPIRFLRFKHMQNKLIKDYIDEGRTKPSIISDIKENALLGGVWDYKDIEYLNQIDILVKNGIIVPTDFNFYGPPYATLYKAIKDGVLLVGGIEHYFESSKEEEIIKDGIRENIRKSGHFITYMCMKKMGPEGTQVLIKYQNELGTTGRMLTCKELDMEMAAMGEGMGTEMKTELDEGMERSKTDKKPKNELINMRKM